MYMYRKNVDNGYIVSISKGNSNGNITEKEYNVIMDVIKDKPTPPDGYDYRLTESLEWELYELPPVVEDLEE